MRLVLNCPSNNHASTGATDCVQRIRSGLTDSAFGYKVQALAGHVLLRLGYTVEEINSSGHPDIVARKGGNTYCYEVEAEVGATRLRRLTDADLASLTDPPGVMGYHALAINIPTPRWILVPASKLTSRARSSPKALLEALSDRELSEAWTHEYLQLLNVACRQIRLASFNVLSERALAGRGM